MYYVSSVMSQGKDLIYGVTDTEDEVTEYYSESSLKKIIKKVQILGVFKTECNFYIVPVREDVVSVCQRSIGTPVIFGVQGLYEIQQGLLYNVQPNGLAILVTDRVTFFSFSHLQTSKVTIEVGIINQNTVDVLRNKLFSLNTREVF